MAPPSIRLADRTLDSSYPIVMGVLNVTPDSFSDGGRHLSPEAAVARAMAMLDEGAGIIDIGPESTRPGSAPVAADEQIRRATPVITAIRQRRPEAIISIDTRLASVAQAAIAAGAQIVNDTSALRDDPNLAAVVADARVAVVLMHRRGTPADMQDGGGPQYDDVVAEITSFLRARCEFALGAGIDPGRIIVDPGVGFGKRLEHNLTILRSLDRLVALGRPVLIGASRKRFIGEISAVDAPALRLGGSLACAIFAADRGAAIIRAHDVAESVQAFKMWRAVRDACGAGPV